MPTATRLFMSGASRASAGSPLAKKRKPGPKRTAVVRANCRYQLFCMPIVFITAICTQVNRCDPISSTNTGRLSAAAIRRSRIRALSSAALRKVTSSDRWAADTATRASYPASSMARIRAAGSACPITCARSVARLTEA